MSDAAALLRAHKMFNGFPDATTAAIAAIATVSRPARGTKVFAKAAANQNVYFVTGGVVRVLVGATELGVLGAGEVLGGLSVLTPQKHAADVEAGDGCELVVIPLVKLQALSKQSANVTSQLVFRLMRAFAVSARALGLEQLFH